MPHLPDHLYQNVAHMSSVAMGMAAIWVPHVKGCQFCMNELVGLDRSDALAQYFKTDVMRPEDHVTMTALQKTIRPSDELFDTLLEVLVWYYLITAPE